MRCTQTVRVTGKMPKRLAEELIEAIGDGGFEPSGPSPTVEEIAGTWESGLELYYYELNPDSTDDLFNFCRKYGLAFWGVMEADMEGAESLRAWIPGVTKQPFHYDLVNGHIALTIPEVEKLLRQVRKGTSTKHFDFMRQIENHKLGKFVVLEEPKKKS